MTRKLTAGHGSLGRYGARFCLSLLVALLVALPWPARADYVPQRGDVLDILVSGVPALKSTSCCRFGWQDRVPHTWRG